MLVILSVPGGRGVGRHVVRGRTGNGPGEVGREGVADEEGKHQGDVAAAGGVAS